MRRWVKMSLLHRTRMTPCSTLESCESSLRFYYPRQYLPRSPTLLSLFLISFPRDLACVQARALHGAGPLLVLLLSSGLS